MPAWRRRSDDDPISAVARVEDMTPHSIVIVGTRLIARTPGTRHITVTRDPLDEHSKQFSAQAARDFWSSQYQTSIGAV